MKAEEMLSDMPELMLPQDLVKIGLYKTMEALWASRIRGISHPPHIRIGSRVMYPKRDLIEYLNKADTFSGDQNKGKGPDSWKGGNLKGVAEWKEKNSNL